MSELWARLVGQDRMTETLRAAATLPGDAYLVDGSQIFNHADRRQPG